MTDAFAHKKQLILDSIGRPAETYSDQSPKGSLDDGIRGLVDLINSLEGVVTTSSCAGRLSVFQEGDKLSEQPCNTGPSQTNQSGKGRGGKWLYVSHDPVNLHGKNISAEFQLCPKTMDDETSDKSHLAIAEASASFIKLQFEPMILHILAASPQYAQLVLSAAMDAGMRESGIQSLSHPFPMVAIRSTGLALSSIVGVVDQSNESRPRSLVDEAYLHTMVALANVRFHANSERINRFERALRTRQFSLSTPWESKTLRADRKRLEGLQKRKEKELARDAARSYKYGQKDDANHDTLEADRLFD